ncbi:MAG: hypothetical protein HKN25_02855 [Pyrinomonadaceae bacterium]|nr:hypothetical protein [Pyrinomonadaceae bacterium]
MSGQSGNFANVLTLLALICAALTLTTCKTSKSSNGSSDTFDADDTAEASKLVLDANDNLKRIRSLYHNSQSKFNEFKKALDDRDAEKVGRLSDELSQIINDGYILAENARAKISDAKEKNINQEWREYLELKETSLDMQIKAFDFRKKSAELFRDKFGGDDTAKLAAAKREFMQNEENFNKYMAEAKKKNKEANDLAKRAAQQDGQMKID